MRPRPIAHRRAQTNCAQIASHKHSRWRLIVACTDRKLRFAAVKGDRAAASGAFTAHRIEFIARSIRAHSRLPTLYTYLRLAGDRDVITRGAAGMIARVWVRATIIWNSVITPPTYVQRAGECVRLSVIIIISRLIIVIRDDARRRSLSPADKRPRPILARSTSPLLPLLSDKEKSPFVYTLPGCQIVGTGLFDATEAFYQVRLLSKLHFV